MDAEPDGQPSREANGDDLNSWAVGGPDDEDGILFGDDWVKITVFSDRPSAHADYNISAWWDLDRNGIFEDDHLFPEKNEHKINEAFNFAVDPDNTYEHVFHVGFNPRDYYSRFRLTWIDNPLNSPFNKGVSLLTHITPTGEFFGQDGISHGEVEDDAPAPGPLPMLGLGAAFGYTRRLRSLRSAGKIDKPSFRCIPTSSDGFRS